MTFLILIVIEVAIPVVLYVVLFMATLVALTNAAPPKSLPWVEIFTILAMLVHYLRIEVEQHLKLLPATPAAK